jgi:hypothetical protein
VSITTREEGKLESLERPSERDQHAGSATRAAQDPDESFDTASEIEKIRSMPKEVGVLLIVAGIGGLLLPGPIGSPFLILGGVMLWPKAFGCVENAFEKRFPRMHRKSVRQIKRFLDDLERRYPVPK